MEQRHLSADDWSRIASDPQFKALLRARRRFVIPAGIFFALFYLALPVSVGFAPAVMSRPFLGALTNAYALALAQFVSSWALLAIYMWRSHAFDSMEERIVERFCTDAVK